MQHAKIVHHIPGRVRVRLVNAKGNPALLRDVMESLKPRKGVRPVEANVHTGSVIVHYDPAMYEHYESALAEHADSSQLFVLKPPDLTEVDDLARQVESEAEYLAAHSETAASIVSFVKMLNDEVKRATHNNLDLKVLLPLGLAVYTFIEAGTETVTPLWITLGIFSFNSFINLHRTPQEVHVVAHPTILNQSEPSAPKNRSRSRSKQPSITKSRQPLAS